MNGHEKKPPEVEEQGDVGMTHMNTGGKGHVDKVNGGRRAKMKWGF